ncbi:MAG: hypothetical protein M3N19_00530 [Candidatus Eremiobacteraeota bacterium]|nr:hypothetical protein [Candidatus Eremiobacteraeota bacterium]
MATLDEVKTQAQTQAGELAGQAKGAIIGQIDQRTRDAGQVITTHAESIRTIGDSLRSQGQDAPARIADMAAGRMEQFGYYLIETDGERIVADLEKLARKQPLLTMAAGLSLGILGARLLKASASQRYQTYGQDHGNHVAGSMSYANSPGTSGSQSYYED